MNVAFPTATALTCAIAAIGLARRGRPTLWPALVFADGALVFAWPLVYRWWPEGAPLFGVLRWALIPLGVLAVASAWTLSRLTSHPRALFWLAALIACPFIGWAISPAPYYLDAIICYLPLVGAAFGAWPRRFRHAA